MFEKLRSLIFKLDPETAHNLAIKALKFNLISQNKIKNKSIETVIFGKTIPNPIGIAAGLIKMLKYIILCLNQDLDLLKLGL